MNEDHTRTSPTGVHDGISAEAILAELEKVLSSLAFRSAPRPSGLLRYAVNQTLAGKAAEVKEYAVGIAVFGRDESFDPRLDGIVRVEATKLRSRLASYYETEGRDDPIRIEFPKGHYLASFRKQLHTTVESNSAAYPSSQTAPSTAPSRVLTRLGRKRVFTALGAALLIFTAAAGVYRLRSLRSTAIVRNQDRSIVVLPFINMNGGKEDEYFSDGLTDEIIASLVRVPRLRVAARMSAFQFKNQTIDVREVGKRLNVNVILEGSVRRIDDRVKITVHLDDASSGYRIWSNTYERGWNDALNIQREISDSIVDALGVQLLSATWKAPGSPDRAIDSEAHVNYLKGMYAFNKRTAKDTNIAIEYFGRAISRDPNYAPFYTALGRSYSILLVYSPTSYTEVIPKIRKAASQAVGLDPGFGEAHILLGLASVLSYDWTEAEREYRLAAELGPNDPVVHFYRSQFLNRVGRVDEGLTEASTAEKLDPISTPCVVEAGNMYLDLRRYDEAIEQYKKALSLEPRSAIGLRGLGLAYLYKGMPTEAISELEKAVQSEGSASFASGELGYAYGMSGRRADAKAILAMLLSNSKTDLFHSLHVAQIYLGLGEKEKVFKFLGDAVDNHEVPLRLKSDPMLDVLRSDPRFKTLLAREKLP